MQQRENKAFDDSKISRKDTAWQNEIRVWVTCVVETIHVINEIPKMRVVLEQWALLFSKKKDDI